MMSKRALSQLARVLEGLPILGCLEGRPAARAGIRYGDVLLAVNGRRTRTFLDYLEARDLCSDGMHVVVFRDGCERTLELAFEPSDTPADPATMLAELSAQRLDPLLPAETEPALS
ncbi:MAG: PDZ domain-containing protein [Polyangiales bacterium]